MIVHALKDPRTGSSPSAAGLGVAVLLSLAGAWSSASAQQTRTPLDDEGHIVQFVRDIQPILQRHCYECHNAEDAKNDFRVDRADEFMGYVEPGDADASTVMTDYLLSDDPDMMMPPPTHGGPLSPAELSLVRVWISEGAQWPDGYQIAPEQEAAVPEPVPVQPTSLAGRLWSFQGFLHPATVHFPIALLLIGAMFVVLGWVWPAVGTQVPLTCLLLGAASSIVATLMGWSFAVQQGYGGWTKFDTDAEIFWHRWSAVIVTVLATVFALIAIQATRRRSDSLNKTWKFGLLVIAAMVGAVGHQGGELTYGKDFYPKAFRILWGATATSPAAATDGAATDNATAGDVDADAADVLTKTPSSVFAGSQR